MGPGENDGARHNRPQSRKEPDETGRSKAKAQTEAEEPKATTNKGARILFRLRHRTPPRMRNVAIVATLPLKPGDGVDSQRLALQDCVRRSGELCTSRVHSDFTWPR